MPCSAIYICRPYGVCGVARQPLQTAAYVTARTVNLAANVVYCFITRYKILIKRSRKLISLVTGFFLRSLSLSLSLSLCVCVCVCVCGLVIAIRFKLIAQARAKNIYLTAMIDERWVDR